MLLTTRLANRVSIFVIVLVCLYVVAGRINGVDFLWLIKLLQGIQYEFQVKAKVDLWNEVFLKVYVRTMLHVLPLYATRTIQFNKKILLQKH